MSDQSPGGGNVVKIQYFQGGQLIIKDSNVEYFLWEVKDAKNVNKHAAAQ